MIWVLELGGLFVGRQTPAVLSVRPLSLPGCLLCWDWLLVYDNEPQLHHHRLDFRHQQRRQWALNPTFHFTEFILSVVTFLVFILNDCGPRFCPAWAGRTFCLAHMTSQCTGRPDDQASRFKWKANCRVTKTDYMHRVIILEAVPFRIMQF